jgi:hypothetical protein
MHAAAELHLHTVPGSPAAAGGRIIAECWQGELAVIVSTTQQQLQQICAALREVACCKFSSQLLCAVVSTCQRITADLLVLFWQRLPPSSIWLEHYAFIYSSHVCALVT